MLITEKHYSHKVLKDVVAICEPLKRYKITYFMYARFFYDGSAFSLTNRWDSFQHHAKKEYPISSPIPSRGQGKKFHYFPFTGITAKSRQVEEYRDLFNLGDPIYFIERYENYLDFFAYGADFQSGGMLSFFSNHLDVLEKFKFYFKDKASGLIKKSNEHAIVLPRRMYFNLSQPHRKTSMIERKQEFMKLLSVKNYSLLGRYGHTSITRREFDVLQCLTYGYTCKETAIHLNLSYRTVEFYLENIKSKLGIRKRSEIIKFMMDHGLSM